MFVSLLIKVRSPVRSVTVDLHGWCNAALYTMEKVLIGHCCKFRVLLPPLWVELLTLPSDMVDGGVGFLTIVLSAVDVLIVLGDLLLSHTLSHEGNSDYSFSSSGSLGSIWLASLSISLSPLVGVLMCAFCPIPPRFLLLLPSSVAVVGGYDMAY